MSWIIREKVMAPDADAGAGGSETAEAKLARMEKELEAEKKKSAEAGEELGKAKQYVAGMIQQFNRIREAQEQQAAGEEEGEDPADLLKKDPIALLNAHFEERMAPILKDRMAADEVTLKQLARDKVGKEKWDKYGKEIEEFMAPMSPMFRAKPGTWEEAYAYVRARHVDDEVEQRFKERVEAEKQATLESSSPNAVGRDGKRVITKDERSVMEEFGIKNDDEWRKWRGDDLPGAGDSVFRVNDVKEGEGEKA